MNIQTVGLSILAHVMVYVLFFAAGWFANDFINKGDSLLNEQVKQIEQERDSLKSTILKGEERVALLKELADTQLFVIDSLKSEIKKQKRLKSIKSAEIDKLIADDSLKAIEQYREALKNLGVIPDLTLDKLTLREIGYGAKYLNGYPMLQLEIDILYEIMGNYVKMDSIKSANIKSLENNNQSYKKLIDKTETQTELYKKAYEHSTRFWANRIIVYAGVGANYDANQKISAGLQLGVGIKLWGNK